MKSQCHIGLHTSLRGCSGMLSKPSAGPYEVMFSAATVFWFFGFLVTAIEQNLQNGFGVKDGAWARSVGRCRGFNERFLNTILASQRLLTIWPVVAVLSPYLCVGLMYKHWPSRINIQRSKCRKNSLGRQRLNK